MAKVIKKIGKKGVAWVVDYFTPEGQRLRKSFDLKKEAEAYLGKVLASKKEGRYHDVFDVKQETLVTLRELADKYVENFGTQRAFNTSKRYWLRVIMEAFGDRRLSEISYLDLETFRNKRKATITRLGTPRSDASVNREMALIGHMLNKAVEWGWLETSPLKKGKRLKFKENNHRLRFLMDAEVKALIDACNPPHLKPIVEAALLTGMRKGELLGLKWEQIRHGLIYIEAKMAKSGKARQIPINDGLAEVFKRLRQVNQLKSEYVFCKGNGRRFVKVDRAFKGSCRRAGLENFHFHDLRHTFASHLVMAGVSLKAVQELLGHADLKMTMRYAHLSQAHLQDAVAVLNGLIDTKMTPDPEKGRKADITKTTTVYNNS